MKKISLLFVALISLLSSCSLIESLSTSTIDQILSATTVEVTASELPSAAQTFLDENYFETYIDVVNFAEGLGYQVILSTEETLFFDTNGEVLVEEECNKGERGHRGHRDHGDHKGKGDLTSLDTTELSTAIKDYITTNYPDAAIKHAKSDQDGNIYVGLDTHIILEFDANGNFVGEFEHHRGHKGNKIELSELPSVITEYIAVNYVNSVLKVAFQGDEGYAVGIVTADNVRKVLIFDAEGVFVEEKTCNGK
jgi:hypothetical protein